MVVAPAKLNLKVALLVKLNNTGTIFCQAAAKAYITNCACLQNGEIGGTFTGIKLSLHPPAYWPLKTAARRGHGCYHTALRCGLAFHTT